MKSIIAEQIDFSKREIEERLQQLDPKSFYEVQKHVFYPYLIFEYVIKRKSFFHPLKGKIGCTIDGVNKVGALADTFPQLTEQKVPSENIIQFILTADEAVILAKKFLYESISRKKKVLTIPELHAARQKMFYRPYWVVAGQSYSLDPFFLTVDAVSGKFHPL